MRGKAAWAGAVARSAMPTLNRKSAIEGGAPEFVAGLARAG